MQRFRFFQGWEEVASMYEDWRLEFFLQTEWYPFSREVFFTYLGKAYDSDEVK